MASAPQAMQVATGWLNQNRSSVTFGINSNPVELGALLALLVLTLLVILFGFREQSVSAKDYHR